MNKRDLEVSLIGLLGKSYRDNHEKVLKFEWEDGLKFEAVIDTLSETDNGKELDDDEFEEYHACFITVKKIIQIPTDYNNVISERFGASLEVNKGYEISYINAPNKIYDIDGILLWES
ncbi:UNVERIFIED_CONTAM: hypothetical protein Cloal_4468 [Acetivibrio alkalicellulosi]